VNGAQRAVTAQAYAACPFSIAQEYAVDYLHHAEAGEAEAQIHVPVRLLPAFFQRRVAVTFGLHADATEAGRPHEEIRLRWNAGTPLLPDFRGTLRFRIAGPGTDVLVEGTYRAPFGALGRAFDDVVGRHIARASIGDLARRIATALETSERAWRSRQLNARVTDAERLGIDENERHPRILGAAVKPAVAGAALNHHVAGL
jgi:hypothetical protein